MDANLYRIELELGAIKRVMYNTFNINDYEEVETFIKSEVFDETEDIRMDNVAVVLRVIDTVLTAGNLHMAERVKLVHIETILKALDSNSTISDIKKAAAAIKAL